MSSIKQQTDQYAASTSSAATAAAAAAYQAAPGTSSHSYPSSDLPQYRMYLLCTIYNIATSGLPEHYMSIVYV